MSEIDARAATVTDTARMTRAMLQASQLCRWRHKRLLQPIVVFENGKVHKIPPEEIELDPTVIDPETGKLR